ncbi:MAG: hypothetical protein ACTTKD_09000 [Peptoanaerobacter stomatis]|uniref:hypothetical protein n=1 Tax=Peptoanaerobacter stomatis TaxID=796937 RepID=UPI003F9EE10B
MFENTIKEEHIINFDSSERVKIYIANFDFEVGKLPLFQYFKNIFIEIPQRDNIKITLSNEDDEIVYINNDRDENLYNNFINKEYENDELIHIKIEINKSIQNNTFSIYSYDKFVQDITQLQLNSIIEAFSVLYKDSPEYIIFEVFSDIIPFKTKTMFFSPKGYENCITNFNRIKRLEECRLYSDFKLFSKYTLLPDDFYIENNFENNPFTSIFSKIRTIFSFLFISYSSTVDNSNIKGNINGQGFKEDYIYDLNSIQENSIAFDIYNWTYTDGNIIDKKILLNNILSVSNKSDIINSLDESILNSIKFNYNLYLKKNMYEYLDMKNKVANFITEIVSKMGEYEMILLEKFKSNIFAIFIFLFTIILNNVVSNKSITNIFTREITILLEFTLASSLIYLIICVIELNHKLKRVFESYYKLKYNYNNIFTENELEKIFENDKIIKETKKKINKAEVIYTIMWVLFLIVSFFVIEKISLSPTIIKL